jgi:homocysteine S-methyltransferase
VSARFRAIGCPHSYQCSFAAFARSGHDLGAARARMLDAVRLADRAVRQFLAERPELARGDVRVALSLGPYGAACSPAQEYDGCYPPPYGPPSATRNAFTEDERGRGDEARAVEALRAFHRERLEVFCNDEVAWAAIDCVAFETVPSVLEIGAIRLAVADIVLRKPDAAAADPGWRMKPWWISALFPGGQYPQQDLNTSGRVNVAEVVRAMVSGIESNAELAIPSAIGINCTATTYMAELLLQMQEAVGRLNDDHPYDVGIPRLRLGIVLYPNGGDVYNPETQTWTSTAAQGQMKDQAWADDVVAAFTGLDPLRWNGAIIGGCCKAGFREINALSSKLASAAIERHLPSTGTRDNTSGS